MAVKQVRVSDLSGRQATEEQFAKLIVHEHPQYQGPIILDVLPEELGELPDSDQYVSIEVVQPGERSGQRALLSVERFNQLAAGGDMNAILMNAVAGQQPQRSVQPRRRGRPARDGQSGGRGKVEWGLPHRSAQRAADAELVSLGLVRRRSIGCGSTVARVSVSGLCGAVPNGPEEAAEPIISCIRPAVRMP